MGDCEWLTLVSAFITYHLFVITICSCGLCERCRPKCSLLLYCHISNAHFLTVLVLCSLDFSRLLFYRFLVESISSFAMTFLLICLIVASCLTAKLRAEISIENRSKLSNPKTQIDKVHEPLHQQIYSYQPNAVSQCYTTFSQQLSLLSSIHC